MRKSKIFVNEVSSNDGKKAMEDEVNDFLISYRENDPEIQWFQSASMSSLASGVYLTAVISYLVDENGDPLSWPK